MARITVKVLKDSERYFGDVQRKARQITGEFFNLARIKYKEGAKTIHPEKAVRLAKRVVESVDYTSIVRISDEIAAELKTSDVIAIGHDIANGRRFHAVLEH